MQGIDLNADQVKSCVQAFFGASGIGCELCSLDGEVIAESGFSCSSCNICKNTGILKEDCGRLHAFTAKASEREGGKYLYECPLGLSCITSAVFTQNGITARLTAGPFLMEDINDFRDYDLASAMRLSPDVIESIMDGLKNVQSMDSEKVAPFSQLLMYSAAFLSGNSRGGESYLDILDRDAINAWEKVNRIDSSKTVEKALAYIENNFSRDISLSDIATDAGITTSYLCRLFKKEKGMTVNAFLTQVRIEKSKELLVTDTPIPEVAKLCGFSDQSYFTKVFRQTEDVTPLKYRKNLKNA